jgi:hypothetical protein
VLLEIDPEFDHAPADAVERRSYTVPADGTG